MKINIPTKLCIYAINAKYLTSYMPHMKSLVPTMQQGAMYMYMTYITEQIWLPHSKYVWWSGYLLNKYLYQQLNFPLFLSKIHLFLFKTINSNCIIWNQMILILIPFNNNRNLEFIFYFEYHLVEDVLGGLPNYNVSLFVVLSNSFLFLKSKKFICDKQ